MFNIILFSQGRLLVANKKGGSIHRIDGARNSLGTEERLDFSFGFAELPTQSGK